MSTLERAPVIDFHVHALHAEVFERGRDHNIASGFGANPMPPAGSRMRGVYETMLDPDAQIEDLDRLGIDVAVVSSPTVIQGTAWADAATAVELNRLVNDMMVEWTTRHPGRFVGSFTLPLQDMDVAMEELGRCVDELGLRLVNMPAHADGRYLGDPSFAPFWQTVAERELTVFVHPHGVEDRWFQQYSLWNSVGQPIEEAKVMSSLIYEGVLERHPELRIVMAHGGGYLPHYFGRLDRNVTNLPDSARNISRRPSEYLRNFYYDTCLYEPAMLEALADRVGADRIVMGSDYPVGETDPVGFVERCGRFSADDLEQVKGGTAARLLGLGPSRPAGAA